MENNYAPVPYAPQNDTYNPKPGKVLAIGIMVLISGITNIAYGIGITCGFMASIVGILCLPIVILPCVLGVFEILYAINFITTTRKPIKLSTAIPILEICCILFGGVIPCIVGVLNLVLTNDEEVQRYCQGTLDSTVK